MAGTRTISARPEVGGQQIALSDQQFEDLIRLHLADFTEQVQRCRELLIDTFVSTRQEIGLNTRGSREARTYT